MVLSEKQQKELIRFYLKASANSYASGNKAVKGIIEGLPDLKGYVFKDGPWEYIDAYIVGEAGYSSGFTYVYLNGQKVLWMSYGGRVIEPTIETLNITSKDVTDFLKEALLDVYSRWDTENRLEELFCGGRGFPKHESQPFVYQNLINKQISGRGIISRFAGRERISHRGTVVFYHDYLGGLLVAVE